MSYLKFQNALITVCIVGLAVFNTSCRSLRHELTSPASVTGGKEPIAATTRAGVTKNASPSTPEPAPIEVASIDPELPGNAVAAPHIEKLQNDPISVSLAMDEKLSSSPVAMDNKTRISKFAGSDMIKHPIGMTFTKDDKLLVIESHTHFRPKTYNGPESDQIIWIRDSDGDGKADTRSLFYGENLKATMNIAIHPDSGAIYVATRSGVIRMRDADGDGVADPDSVEKVIFFDFESQFLDNGYGCAGLCFDHDGNLIFGIGGLLGAPYTLEDRSGNHYSNQGEGGNIWKCTEDGKDLTHFATGFWNPFGLCFTPEGHVFATDNDPSSRPPSRLHHVIDGGDYGYQYRYGRSGQHPFISWDGELPGALPMLSGTGDAPCEIFHHKGNLILSSWSDHRIEVYPLKWNKTHFTTEPKTLVKGGVDFRPVGFALKQNGDLFVSDWVKGDYQLHGHGAIWKLENWTPEESHTGTDSPRLHDTDPEDPWTFSRMISGTAAEAPMSQERKQIFDLLSARFHSKENGHQLITAALAKDQTSETLRLLALKWIADDKLAKFISQVEKEIQNPASAAIFEAAITVKARLTDQGTMDKDLQKLVLGELDSDSALARRAAFLILDEREKIELTKLKEIYQNGDDYMRAGVALTLRHHEDPEGAKALAREIMEKEESEKIISFASLADPDAEAIKLNDPLEHGEYLFHKNCAKCHCVDGFGKRGGLDLSAIGVRGREHIIRSIHQPSLEIAPQYETWKVLMADGKEHVGFVIGEMAGIHYYSDAAGNRFTINTTNMVEREHLPYSLMPPMLNRQIGEENFKDLVDWLVQLK